jgi:hypothetical protein
LWKICFPNLKFEIISSYGTIDFNTPTGLSGQFVTTGASYTNGIFVGDQLALASYATNGSTAIVAGEDQNLGGNGLFRYQTRKISLANGFDAGDLRVFVQCVRPKGTYVQAYYKALGSADTQDFIDLPWVPMTLVKDVFSPDRLTTIELDFAPSVNQVTGEPSGRLQYISGESVFPVGGTFKQFAVKLVCFANDPTVHPVLSSMRAIALPGEPAF